MIQRSGGSDREKRCSVLNELALGCPRKHPRIDEALRKDNGQGFPPGTSQSTGLKHFPFKTQDVSEMMSGFGVTTQAHMKPHLACSYISLC